MATARPLGARALVLALITATACTGGAAPPPSSGDRPPVVTLLAENLTLLPGTASATRIGFDPFEGAAQIIVTTTPDTAQVTVCPLGTIDETLPPLSTCRRGIGSGVREPISMAAMRAIAIVVTEPRAIPADLRLEFEEVSRDITIAIPRMRAPGGGTSCDDNACNPFFELTPSRAGAFSARARWSGPDATLALLQGRVLGRSQTATGVPYVQAAIDEGASPLSVATSLTSPAEYALIFRHRALRPGDPDLRDVVIDATWP